MSEKKKSILLSLLLADPFCQGLSGEMKARTQTQENGSFFYI